jgi:ATP-dependent helicase Lhr and Lhr-like helicase
MTPSELFHPLVAGWFDNRFASPTEPQIRGWPAIAARRNTLIAAPTGSGKTLTAFLACLDRLIRQGLSGTLQDRTEVLYISPLKALGNDIQKNLEEPLRELREAVERQGMTLPEIRVAVRTGDTSQADRQRMIKKPPHILITTPESLYILLTAERSRQMLRSVDTLIVDEIHAVADDKRGSHLSISIERLEALCDRPPVRIGLSATQKPIEAVGRLLVGTSRPMPEIIDAGHRRKLDLAIEVVKDELGAVCTHEQWSEILDKLAELVREHRSTLVFVNTRRLVERISHQLEERLGADAVAAHHGSLSRKTRLLAEQRLKNGQLKVVVATASLELGIDVGTVDLVCQIGSPRAIAVALQRVGRSGHFTGAVPKGRLFALTRDELIECLALVHAIRRGDLDQLEIPTAPLDILAQQIVAACAAGDWEEDRLFDLVRSASPYRDLSREAFDQVVVMLSEGISARRGRAAALLHHDRVNHRLRGRRNARLAAVTAGGAIPEVADYQVIADPEGTFVGTVDEDFAVESMAGDVFLLGNTSWRVRRIEMGKVRVEDAKGAAPTIPFWRGEAPSRTAELSAEVAAMRAAIASRADASGPEAASQWLQAETGVARIGAEQAVAYVLAGRNALSALPTQKQIVAERFFDEAGGMQLVIHAPFGGRINRAWGLSLRKRFCRSFNFELQAAATDDGLLISLGEVHSFPLEMVFEMLKSNTVVEVLSQAVLAVPMFGTRFRWNATRSLALPRWSGGKRVPPPIQRMRAEDLTAAVFPAQMACAENLPGGDIPIPDHPLVNQTMTDCLSEAMDAEGLVRVLRDIESGAIQTVSRDTPEPSPFSAQIVNSQPYTFLDDAPLEERRARAVSMRRSLPESAGELGALDLDAIEEVRRESWPDVRDADELHDTLLSLGLVSQSEGESWTALFDELVAQNRATRVWRAQGGPAWAPAERLASIRSLFPGARIEPPIRALDESDSHDRDAVALSVVRGRMEIAGPVTVDGLAATLGLPSTQVDEVMHRLEAEGIVLRGRFTPSLPEGAVEWCERHLLARIHRRTLGRLRREIEPVSPADFIRFLLRWQHVAPGTQLHGVPGLRAVIAQLQGFELAASAWEQSVLPSRLGAYDSSWLDLLCLNGDVAWGRLSRPVDPTPRPLAPGDTTGSGTRNSLRGGRGARPTRAAPISLVLRSNLPWLLEAPLPGAEPIPMSTQASAVNEFLSRRGASFFGDIVGGTGRLQSEVEDGLGELVSRGLVTGDGFAALRSIIGGARNRHPVGARHATGRWSLTQPAVEPSASPTDSVSKDDPGPTPAERFARQLLVRWGVVTRDLIVRETRAPSWRDLAMALRRLEARGEIRGGRFIAGTTGEQFAQPEAVESLRAVRRTKPSAERVKVSAADPLNLVGILTPGPRVAATARNAIVYVDGVPVETFESGQTVERARVA